MQVRAIIQLSEQLVSVCRVPEGMILATGQCQANMV